MLFSEKYSVELGIECRDLYLASTQTQPPDVNYRGHTFSVTLLSESPKHDSIQLHHLFARLDQPDLQKSKCPKEETTPKCDEHHHRQCQFGVATLGRFPVNISGNVPGGADDKAEESEVQGALAEDLAVGGRLGHHLGPGQVDVTVDGLGIPETGLRVPGK